MASRNKIYFAADVHLGLKTGDEAAREARFVSWLKSINCDDTAALYLLGDIWDFWYEYRDVIPREGTRVISAIINLLDAGIEVYYIPGNHDIWMYSFWQNLGVKVISQPQVLSLEGKDFLIGHGDGLGGAKWGYKLMLWVFHNKVCQALFNLLHPWIAYRFGTDWSNSNRRKHGGYKFKGESEPLYKFCVSECAKTHIDYCIFGHFHDAVDMTLPAGERLIVVKDWIADETPHFVCWDGSTLTVK